MAGPIYKLWMMKLKEAAYQLSEEERNDLAAKNQEALQKVGGKPIVMCACDWENESWTYFGVEEFPDIEAVQKLSELHNELNWFQYVDAFTLLGVETSPHSITLSTVRNFLILVSGRRGCRYEGLHAAC